MRFLAPLLPLIFLIGCGVKTEFVPIKCDLPPHAAPMPLDSNATNGEFLIYLKNLLQDYELLLKDYDECRK